MAALNYFVLSFENRSLVREKFIVDGRDAALKWVEHFRQAEPNREHRMEGRMPQPPESERIGAPGPRGFVL